MKTTERFALVALDKLIDYAQNARTHSKNQIQKLKSSLTEYGFVNPILCDVNFNILAGHGRAIAARELGLKEVPCVFVEHLSEAQKRGYILADNRLALDAGWDDEMLAVAFDDLKELGFDLAFTGFEEAEIGKISAAANGEVQDDDFDVDAELEKPTFSRLGDVWTLGNHRLICGDSTKPETYERLMQGKLANLIVTDPPYGIDYKGAAGKIKNDKFDSDEGLYTFLLSAFQSMEAHLATDGAAYVFHADSKGLVFRKAFDDAGFKLSGCCIWAKNTFTLGRSDYQWCHEPCLYGWKKSGKHNWYGDRKQSTIWHCDKPSRSEKHPTMKPIPLLAVPISNSTQTNGVVLEPFCGSGSTLVCCEQLGRVCYAAELEEKFLDVTIDRFRKMNPGAEIIVERDGQILRWEEVKPL
jgi:DNA modification methylase